VLNEHLWVNTMSKSSGSDFTLLWDLIAWIKKYYPNSREQGTQ
jgi:hypothetical protein